MSDAVFLLRSRRADWSWPGVDPRPPSGQRRCLSKTPPIPTRNPLSVIPIAPAKPVSRVETNEVDFLPGQAM